MIRVRFAHCQPITFNPKQLYLLKKSFSNHLRSKLDAQRRRAAIPTRETG